LLNRRKLWLVLAVAAAMSIGMAMAAIPSASADACTVKVTLAGGQVLTFNVNVPPGTPISSMQLPITGVVVSESESCVPSSSSSTTTTTSTTTSSSGSTSSGSSSSTSTSTSTSSSTTTSSSSTTPKPTKPGKPQKRSSHPAKAPAAPTVAKKAKHKKKSTMPNGKGVPAASNPTFSLSLPGPAAIGVPNFFIDSFRIPPFLIPIYQAAGIEYQVPWQVLAGINEIETDYGRNLSVSSAGAVGWMQFLPSTWKEWGVDANGDGVADPYNPVDAIFTAARYLHAAGASKNLSTAIFAYNHASWYVQSVLLRAKLIGGIPSQLIGALTGLVQGHFPVAAAAKYADSNVVGLTKHKIKSGNAAIAIDSSPSSRGTSIFAKKGSPVIAVNDGKVIKIGQNAKLGHYIQLQDETGNIYTYSQLGSVSKSYPVPKPVKVTAREIAQELAAPVAKAPTTPASAGQQAAAALPAVTKSIPTVHVASPGAGASAGTQTSAASAKPGKAGASGQPITLPVKPAKTGAAAAPATVTAPLVKERLFANPSRAASYAAGGSLQLKNSGQQISNFQSYFSDALHLGRNQYRLQTLKAGSIVVAGTILGRIGGPTQDLSSHLFFTIQPAGKKAPLIDPKPILDGWKLLEATAVYRAAGVDPFFGPGAKNPSVGQVLLMSKEQLTERVLQDPHVQVYNCGRRDIATGLIDRRVLATIEFLVASGLDPDVTGLKCGHSLSGSNGVDAAGATGSSVDISKINNIPVLGHQASGSITDITIRRLLTLQGAMRPDQIISTIAYKGQNNTLALPDHKNRIQISFTPDYGSNKTLSAQIKSILQPGQWIHLINRISQIPEPIVPIAPSKYAIRTHQH
jgi:Transglycosylase SLT domain/Peptidase family M23